MKKTALPFWLSFIVLVVFSSGCVSLMPSERPLVSATYLPSSHFERNWGWVRTSYRPPVYRAGEHKIVFELGTNYAMIDGQSVNLRKPLYSLGREIYIPSEIVKKYPYLKYQTRRYIPREPAKSKTKGSPIPTPHPTPTPPRPKIKAAPPVEDKYDTLDFGFASLPGGLRLPRHNWKYIVIHHSSTDTGSASSFHRYHKFNRHWKNGLGYHFVIGNGSQSSNGQIEIGPRWKKQQAGAHAGSNRYNQQGIGICLVGNFQHKNPSANQIAALVKLTRALMNRYKIPLSRVLPHQKVRRGHTDCPGKTFPWKTFIQRVQQGG